MLSQVPNSAFENGKQKWQAPASGVGGKALEPQARMSVRYRALSIHRFLRVFPNVTARRLGGGNGRAATAGWAKAHSAGQRGGIDARRSSLIAGQVTAKTLLVSKPSCIGAGGVGRTSIAGGKSASANPRSWVVWAAQQANRRGAVIAEIDGRRRRIRNIWWTGRCRPRQKK